MTYAYTCETISIIMTVMNVSITAKSFLPLFNPSLQLTLSLYITWHFLEWNYTVCTLKKYGLCHFEIQTEIHPYC